MKQTMIVGGYSPSCKYLTRFTRKWWAKNFDGFEIITSHTITGLVGGGKPLDTSLNGRRAIR